MTYTNDVPQANQAIASTQVPILNNFSYIDTALKINHTWNGNTISTEAPGSHQRLDMPNQGSDITSLPSGIAAVMYSIGNNIFSWNGTKQIVSGTVIATTGTFTTTPSTIATLPANCTGFVFFAESTVGGQSVGNTLFFMTNSSVCTVTNGVHTPSTVMVLSSTGTTLKMGTVSGTLTNTPYKIYYWPI